MKFISYSVVISALALGSLFGEDSIYTRVGDLSNDVATMSEDVGQVKLDVEELGRENLKLTQQLKEQAESFEARLKAQEEDFVAQLAKVREDVKEQVLVIQDRAQASMDELAKKLTPPKPVEKPKPAITFSDNYPKEGIEYTVKQGDTLSVIAIKNNSTTSYIQNANKIADPKDLRAGQTIFIPIKKEG